VPMVLKPVQRPYPPLWYGIVAADAAYWAALEKAHIVTLLPPDLARAAIERYRLEWKKLGRPEAELPLMGVSRHVVLANSSAEAVRIAERAYRPWLKHMELLWVRNGSKLPLGLPPEIGPLLDVRAAFAGTVNDFKMYLEDQVRSTGATYFVCDVAFGDLTPEESLQTIKLLGEQIIAHFVD
jgi:alkanesulfonate monooxygenase SsuD/methylene tetrahydromethanopterin reductase-like flavin-dependent oxidoreductase (luciferase family)